MCARTRGRGRAGPPAREPWPNANGSIQKFLRLRTLTLAPPCVPKGAAQRSCWGEGARTHEHPRTEWAPCERVSAQPLSRPLLPSNPSMVLLPSPSPLSCPPRGLPALLSGACSRSHRPTPKIKKFRRRGGGGGSAALPRPPRPPPFPLSQLLFSSADAWHVHHHAAVRRVRRRGRHVPRSPASQPPPSAARARVPAPRLSAWRRTAHGASNHAPALSPRGPSPLALVQSWAGGACARSSPFARASAEPARPHRAWSPAHRPLPGKLSLRTAVSRPAVSARAGAEHTDPWSGWLLPSSGGLMPSISPPMGRERLSSEWSWAAAANGERSKADARAILRASGVTSLFCHTLIAAQWRVQCMCA